MFTDTGGIDDIISELIGDGFDHAFKNCYQPILFRKVFVVSVLDPTCIENIFQKMVRVTVSEFHRIGDGNQVLFSLYPWRYHPG